MDYLNRLLECEKKRVKGVYQMRNSVEQRREKLINKLFIFHVFKIDGQQLYELPLGILEREYRKFKSENHPHGEYSSLKWT